MRTKGVRKGIRRVLAGAAILVMLSATGAPLAEACYGGAAMGMGGAYTALADGVLAVYWNQAGLVFTPGRGEASTTLTFPKDSLNYNAFHGAAVKLTDHLAVGAGRTDVYTSSLWDFYGVERRETWDTLAVGLKLSDELAIGGAYRKVSGRVLDDGTPFESEGVDLSAQYRSGPLRLGLLIQDVNQDTETGLYPRTWMRNVRPALAVELDKLTVAMDVYDAEELRYALRGDYGYYAHQAGLEYRPYGKEGPLALRAGFYQEIIQLGLGVKTGRLFADVAWFPESEILHLTGGVRF